MSDEQLEQEANAAELVPVNAPAPSTPDPTSQVTLLGPENELVGHFDVTWDQYPDVVQQGARVYVKHQEDGIARAGVYKRATVGVLPTGKLTRLDGPK